jgi:hypothetical protein
LLDVGIIKINILSLSENIVNQAKSFPNEQHWWENDDDTSMWVTFMLALLSMISGYLNALVCFNISPSQGIWQKLSLIFKHSKLDPYYYIRDPLSCESIHNTIS